MTRPNRETPNVPGLKCINLDQRLFVIPCGSGYSCLGFDVAHRKTAAVAAWLGRPDLAPPARKGTVKAWRAYQAAMKAAAAHHAATRQRCPADLTPALVGLEGKRVEVSYPDGEGGTYRTRFIVGKSTGWMPIHLQIARRDSTGGPAACVPPGASVHVVA